MSSLTVKPKRSHRKQVAALPLTLCDCEVLALLVTSRSTGRWVLPKGWTKGRIGPVETAVLEAFEEAGLKGEIRAESVGSYTYFKQMPDGSQVKCKVDVFPMHVERELDFWPEDTQRLRRWFFARDAARLVQESELSDLLKNLDAATVRSWFGESQPNT